MLRNSGPEKWIKRIKQDLRCPGTPDLKSGLRGLRGLSRFKQVNAGLRRLGTPDLKKRIKRIKQD